MTYRDDPTRTEESTLSRELAALQAREREVRAALDAARAKRRGTHALPLLADLRIASPCRERWDEMRGDDRVRFCGKCEKNVYDLSSMTRDEAEALLASKGETPCVRFYRRTDGTVLTSDCPVGARAKTVRRVVAGLGVGGLGAMAMAGLSACVMGAPAPREPVMGAIAPPVQPQADAGAHPDDAKMGEAVMGAPPAR